MEQTPWLRDGGGVGGGAGAGRQGEEILSDHQISPGTARGWDREDSSPGGGEGGLGGREGRGGGCRGLEGAEGCCDRGRVVWCGWVVQLL